MYLRTAEFIILSLPRRATQKSVLLNCGTAIGRGWRWCAGVQAKILSWLSCAMMKHYTTNSVIQKQAGFTFMEILATMVLIGLILPAAMKGIS
ncbi:MAG: type II secretion system protein, partial [Phycisphaerae bacterium]|nr:type II secretion system protein [Phycisphaerae bacterium]